MFEAKILMSSGETDEWEDVEDVVDDRGSLMVLSEIEEGQDLSRIKTIEITKEILQPSEVGVLREPVYAKQTTLYQVLAQYAPGMWMKVEFE